MIWNAYTVQVTIRIIVIEAAYVNDDKFVNHFDEYGVNMVNNIASLTIEFPEVLENSETTIYARFFR